MQQHRFGIPAAIWDPLMTGALILLVGVLGYAFAQPWFFPSLGPTAYMQAAAPGHRQSRIYNVVVGHGIGILAGFLAVAMLGAAHSPPAHLDAVRIWAGALAVALTVLGGVLLHAEHVPACSTTLMVALGLVEDTLVEGLILMLGVVVLGIAGEAVRRLRLQQRMA